MGHRWEVKVRERIFSKWLDGDLSNVELAFYHFLKTCNILLTISDRAEPPHRFNLVKRSDQKLKFGTKS